MSVAIYFFFLQSQLGENIVYLEPLISHLELADITFWQQIDVFGNFHGPKVVKAPLDSLSLEKGYSECLNRPWSMKFYIFLSRLFS